ncbi:hypothetical protein EDC01DRAFT_619861, partial [Geopyxis carbonaria]
VFSDNKLAPALYYSPAPERLPSPHQLLHPPSPAPSNCSDETTLPAISRPTSRSPLPSLSTLASVALPSPPSRLGGLMTFATSSPGASTAGQGTTPPICQNCTTSTTPLWRRDEAGSVLCNACGLFLKLHGRPRPISLKTDVIKSRNRVKNSGQPQKKKSLFDAPAIAPHPAPRSENGTPPPGHRHIHGNASTRSVSPQSRSGTPLPPPSHLGHSSLYDPMMSHPMDHSNTLPSLNTLNQPAGSPAGSHSSMSERHMEQPPTMDSLINTNNKLKTRVAELELVNDLFRSRVTELENSEANIRRAEISRREVETQLRLCLDSAQKKEGELKRRLEDTERELQEVRGDRLRKKVRVSDLTA